MTADDYMRELSHLVEKVGGDPDWLRILIEEILVWERPKTPDGFYVA